MFEDVWACVLGVSGCLCAWLWAAAPLLCHGQQGTRCPEYPLHIMICMCMTVTSPDSGKTQKPDKIGTTMPS